ncbi:MULTISPECIES: DNA polymerase IV [unclassified Pseudodesulfovibrio]|uniref:DNA polymerase IV n=1 Tax=unclassified Pseudodesulfovibrio TaxID=2661612 RepID=UPI000FEB95F9|nr:MULTISPECIES: DNA polymerase IV [unclassified Pseudodesulfovibrio]MCJ2165876.1 DNA polymerase IV [Pseudodesulfovibrio sp. S3-i]RWU02693.1 DNA polymerase IV [Pseudodesulfovibrio sp. S3]
MLRWILHIDMDAFFASVEQLDNPELRGKPVAVGGTSDRSVVSAASYEVRQYGVRSAMSVVKARQLCPGIILVPGRMKRYKEISGQVMGVLKEFSPTVEQASVDEAYLDGTGLERLFGPIEEVGRRIKARMREVTGLTCSVGAAPVRFLAKIASDMDKPDGMYIIGHEEMHDFLRTLPVRKIPGVGAKLVEILKRLGVNTCGDVLLKPREHWEERLGKYGGALHDRACGIDPNPVRVTEAAKSCSAENTFHQDTTDRLVLRKWLLAQSERVGEDLRRHGYRGRTVTLKIKFSDFKQITRSKSLEVRTDNTAVIFETACALLKQVELVRAVRLIGVGVSNFGTRTRQVNLFEEEPHKVEATSELDKAVDAVRRKFGGKAVTRVELLEFNKKPTNSAD